jgi:hypothetical protein
LNGKKAAAKSKAKPKAGATSAVAGGQGDDYREVLNLLLGSSAPKEKTKQTSAAKKRKASE